MEPEQARGQSSARRTPTELEPALLQAELEDMCQDEDPGQWEDLLDDPDWVPHGQSFFVVVRGGAQLMPQGSH